MRRLQFSMRTAVVLLILVSIGLGRLASLYHAAQREALIAQQIQSFGASVTFDDRLFPHIAGVYVGGGKNIDALLPLIGKCPELTELTIQSATFSNEGLRELASLTKLEAVDLSWTNVSDDGLRVLATIESIRVLKLNKSFPPIPISGVNAGQISNHGLTSISKLPRLEKLVLWGAEITDDALGELAECENLQTLWLVDTQIDGRGLAHLRGLKQLRELNLCDTRVTADPLQAIVDLPSLTSLMVARTAVDQHQALAIQARRGGGFTVGY